MEVSTVQELGVEDLRPAAARKIGDALKAAPDVWHTLTFEELTDLLIQPGARGLPGDDETIDVANRLNDENKTMRSTAYYSRLRDRKHEVIYSKETEIPKSATAGPAGVVKDGSWKVPGNAAFDGMES